MKERKNDTHSTVRPSHEQRSEKAMVGSALASRPHRGTNTVYHAYEHDPHLATRPLLLSLVEKHNAPTKETVPKETDVTLEQPIESSMS